MKELEELGLRLSGLEEQQRAVLAALRSRRKDGWDILSAMSTFVSGVLLVIIGGTFTYCHEKGKEKRATQAEVEAQRLREFQTASALMPFITSKEVEVKRTALHLVRELTSTNFMTAMAKLEPTRASAEALDAVASSLDSTPTERETAQRALDDIFQLRRAAVVKVIAVIDGRSQYKSGFVVSSEGHVMTAAFALSGHPDVFENRASSVSVFTLDGKEHRAAVVGISRDAGVAILRIPPQNSRVEFASDPPSQGEAVLVIGSTEREFLIRVTGFVTEVAEREVEYARGRATVPGFGGGPVFDMDGKVVGINWGALGSPAPATAAKFLRGERARAYMTSVM